MTSSPPAESPKRSFDWPNLRLRLISAGVLIPLALLAVWLGGWAYLLLLAVAVALLSSEWAKMCAPVGVSRAAALMAAAVLVALFIGFDSLVRIGWLALPIGAALAALVARVAGWTPRSADVGFGVVYVGAPCLSLLWLRENDLLRDTPANLLSSGIWWTALLFVSTWAADVGAFAGGSVFKGAKLWPRISPNKTWSGFWSGLVASGLAAAALWALPLRETPLLGLPATIGIGVGAGLATMGGDLLESMLKRRFGVKDSGDLIPGHGGLLDRVDGMLAAALAVAVARLMAQAGVIA